MLNGLLRSSDFVADMRQQPASEPTSGFIWRHDYDGITRQKQGQHHGVEAVMVIGDDQQAISMPERGQVTEDADTKEQPQQQANQRGHRPVNRQVFLVMAVEFWHEIHNCTQNPWLGVPY